MRRIRGYEILALALALALLPAAELVVGAAAAPSAPALEPKPAHAEFDGMLSQEHALARAGAGTQSAVGTFVAVVPAVDEAGRDPAWTADAAGVPGELAFSAPRVPPVRAPPPR